MFLRFGKHTVHIIKFYEVKLLRRRIKNGLCIKVGRRQGDGDIGTRVWGLVTRGRETRNLRTSSMGRRDVWDGDAGTPNTGTQRTRDVNSYSKSRAILDLLKSFVSRPRVPSPHTRVPMSPSPCPLSSFIHSLKNISL